MCVCVRVAYDDATKVRDKLSSPLHRNYINVDKGIMYPA